MTLLSALDMTDYPLLWRVFPAFTFIVNTLLGGNLRFQTLTEPFAIHADGPLTPVFEEFASGVELNTCRDGDARRALWRSPGFKERFRADWERRERRTFHRDPARMTIEGSPDPAHVGRTIAAVARERAVDPTTALMQLLEEHDERLRWVACGANERASVRERLMGHRHILPGFSDAGAHSRNIAFFDAALTLIRHAVATGFMSPARAIARVTGEAARWFNIDAGRLRVGARADVLVLNPQALRQPSAAPIEVDDPLLDGVRRMVKRGSEAALVSVFVGGTEVVRDGAPCAALGTERTGALLAPARVTEGRAAVLARYRNRLDGDTLDHPFRDYWDIFVFKHQARGNVLLHCLAVPMMYFAALAALVTWNAWWLLLVPVSQVTGLAGHALYERSHVDVRDLVFSWRASRSLNRMFLSVVRGRYWDEVRRVRHAFDQFSGVAP